MLPTKQFMQVLATHLIWPWSFILHRFFSSSKSQSPSIATAPRVGKTGLVSSRGEGRKECSICSVKIDGEEDDVKELNCGHHFHGVCLDGRVSHAVETNCPICRGNLGQPVMVEEVQPLLEFCSLGSSHRGSDAWWLR